MKIATMSAMIALIVGFRAALFAEGVSDQCEFLPPLIPQGGSLASRARCCELLPDADACSVSSQYADEYNCRNTLDGEYDEDKGWYARQTTNQWIAYDLKETHNVTGVCLVWDWFDDKIYGATSVRVDTSTDGSTWTEGATYDEGDGMCGSLGDPSSLPADVMDACFTLKSAVATRHIRLFLQQGVHLGTEDDYLGIAEVRFLESGGPTCAPTAAPTGVPTYSPTTHPFATPFP